MERKITVPDILKRKVKGAASTHGAKSMLLRGAGRSSLPTLDETTN